MATILITGASRGIGRELARQALERGDRVIATARDPADLDGLEPSRTLALDVTDPDSLTRAADELEADLDLLVCNAGVFRGRGAIEADGNSAEDWRTVLMTNVYGPFATVRAFLPHLRRAERARVAIIGSIMGSSCSAAGTDFAYRASKAAAANLAVNLAVELAPTIAVGVYHPGWVRTDMTGSKAKVTVGKSAAGLLERFDALGPETSGAFEDYEGTPIPF